MGFFAEFKTFIMRGNVVDLAVGVVIGAAFGKIVSSFVTDVLMPPLGLLTGGIDFSNLQWVLKSHTDDKGALVIDAALKYGLFINNIINFVIQAAAIFILIKLINMLYKKQAAAPAAPTKQEELLAEIRDILAAKKA